MKLFSKDDLLELLKKELEALDENRIFNILLSGGHSVEFVVAFLKGIDSKLKRRITLIVSDERMVSWDSNESNSGSLMRELGTEFNFVTPYLEKEISIENAKSIYQNIESVDLAILGVGEDGHVASLFPQNQEVALSTDLILTEHSPKPPKRRLSVSYEFIGKSKRGSVLIMGEGKSHLLSRAQEGLPFQRLIDKFGFICTTDWK